jgi:hypothetical protein
VVFIPRKPHKNGFINYQLVTVFERNSTHYPFVIDFEPFYRYPFPSPHICIEKFLQRWRWNTPAHICGDKAFGNSLVVEAIQRHHALATLAIPKDCFREVWDLIEQDLTMNRWRAAKKGQLIASCRRVRSPDGETTFQRLMHVSNEAEDEGMQVIIQCDDNLNYDFLQKKTIQELKALCDSLNIKHGRNKKEIIERILKRSETTGRRSHELNKTHREFENSSFENDEENFHNLYKRFFNGIDLHDRYYYRLHTRMAVQNWKRKLLQCLIRSLYINVFSMVNAQLIIPWTEYCRTLAKILINLSENEITFFLN